MNSNDELDAIVQQAEKEASMAATFPFTQIAKTEALTTEVMEILYQAL